MTELDGATEYGHAHAYPATPGEFAARWNEWTEERRADWLARAVEDSQSAARCFTQDHEHVIDVSRDARINDRQTGITIREFARRLDWWENREHHTTIGIAWLRNHFQRMLDRYPIEAQERSSASTTEFKEL